jgi:hypothetical protein
MATVAAPVTAMFFAFTPFLATLLRALFTSFAPGLRV